MDGAPGTRPLAGDMAAFEQLHDERGLLYRAAADAIVAGEESPEAVAGAIAQQVWTRPGIAETALGEGAVAIVDRALTLARAGAIELEGGEAAKSLATLERLWRALAERELERGDVVVCAGGGSITDVGGFAAATFRRGVPWLAVPSTLVGQVDAAIGGKTAINVAAKNDVGRVLAAEGACSAIPRCWRRCRRASGPAAWPRSSRQRLLAGGRLWELVEGWEPGIGELAARSELVQRCVGVKTLVVAADPEDRGPRAILNLGHTIGHGIESVAGLRRPLARRMRVDRPRGRAASLRGPEPASRRALPSTWPGCWSATGCPCVRPGSTPRRCWRPCATTRSEARGRTGWCCWRRSGGPCTASPSTSRCSPTPYAPPPQPTRLNQCASPC